MKAGDVLSDGTAITAREAVLCDIALERLAQIAKFGKRADDHLAAVRWHDG